VRSAPARLDLTPGKSLVRDGDLEVRRFGDDGAVSPPARDERVRTDARVLLVDNRRNQQASCAKAAFADEARRIDHRGHAALHILRAATVKTPVLLQRVERRGHPVHPHGVEVPAEHERAPRRHCFEHADNVRTSRCNFLDLDVHADLPHARCNRLGDLSFARGPGHQRGIHRVDCDEITKQGNDGIGRHVWR